MTRTQAELNLSRDVALDLTRKLVKICSEGRGQEGQALVDQFEFLEKLCR